MKRLCTIGFLLRVFLLVVLVTSICPAAAWAQAQLQGSWGTLPYQMPINPIHVSLMHTGKVLVVAGSGNDSGNNLLQAAVWDPQVGTINVQNVSWDMFCNGMVVLPDGRPMVAGGNLQYNPFEGLAKVAVFDPATNSFTNVASMAHGRWYPTLTVLADGTVMAFSGLDTNGNTTNTLEIFNPATGTWSTPYTASWTPPLYPRLHLLPNGTVFFSGDSPDSAIFNPSTHTWTTNVATTVYGNSRLYGSSVLLPLTPQNNYRPKVMILGGGNPATNTTEIIDLSAFSPSWQSTANMYQGRIEMNAVLLPSGKILALGGSMADEDSTSASLRAELYDPTSNVFTSAGNEAYARLYHSVALLLPDATIWVAGGNPTQGDYEPHMEVYSPPYLFTTDANGTVFPAVRPTISSAPATITYGANFAVQTPDAANIASVVLMRNGASTHAFDMEQRMVGLSFAASSGSLTVTGPPSSTIAPPGYYMLFLLNSSGVPSVSTFVQVVSSGQPAAATPSFTPAPGSYGFPEMVSISDATPGSTIYYTTDGSTPTTSSAIYSGAINIPADTVLQAIAVAPGYSPSQVATGDYSIVGAAALFAQVAAATPASGSKVAVSYPGAQTAGNLNVVVVGWNDSASTVASVSDTAGNTYSLAVGPTRGTNLSQSIYYARNIKGGSNTVNVTFNQSVPYPDIRVLEYAGLDPVSPVDVTAAAAGDSSTSSSGSATTTVSDELLFAANTVWTSSFGPGGNFTARMITADGDIAEDLVVTAIGSYSATVPLNTSGPWVMQMVGFKAANAGPPPVSISVSPGSANVQVSQPQQFSATVQNAGNTAVSWSLAGTGCSGTSCGTLNNVTANPVTYTAPSSVPNPATVTLTATSAADSTKTASATITVVPPPPVAPIGLTATAGNAQVALTWTGSSGTTSYNVKRSTTSGGPYTTVGSSNTTSFTDTGLVNGTTYYYVVTAVNAGGESTPSNQASAMPEPSAPGAPTGLTASAGNAQVALTWTGSSSATSYNVKRSTTSGGPYTTVGSSSSTSYIDQGLTNGTTYYYVVTAVNISGESPISNQVAATPQLPPPPPAPTGLTATPGNAQVALIWTGSSGATSYNVKRSATSGGPYSTVGSSSTTSFTDSGLVNGTTYYYVVTALNAGGESPISNQVAATPQHAPPPPPTGLTASAGNGQVALTWTGSSGATGYNVKRSTTSGGPYGTVGSSNTTSFTDTGLVNGTTYYYVVTAVNAGGESTPSNQVAATPQSVPISFVQVAATTPTSGSNVSTSYGGLQTAGDLNVVVVGWNDSTSTVTNVSDTAGNIYSLAIGPTRGTNLSQSIYYSNNILGGNNTVKVTFSQSVPYPDIRVLEYKGVSILDVKAGASGKGSTSSSGSATTTTARELIFGANTVANSTKGHGTGFTSRIITADGDIAEDRIVSTIGSYSASAPLNGNGAWVMQMVTFK